MKRIKNFTLGILGATILSLGLYSCSNDNEATTSNASTEQNVMAAKENNDLGVLLFEKYGLEQSDFDYDSNPIIIDGIKTNRLNSTVYKKDSKVFVILKKDDKRFTLVKGEVINNDFAIEANIQMENSLDSNGNGLIFIKNIKDNIEFTSQFENGKIVGNESVETTKTSSLCQRKKNESYRECFNRESDEFCDGFVSTVAYITNPTIPILIAALCDCYEK